jgi:hypothetical protein
MSEQTEVPFPAAPNAADEQRRERELDARLKLLIEVSRVICYRAVMAEGFSRQHKGWWQEGWQAQKAERLHALARIIASDEFAGLVRGSPELRRLFSRDMPAIPPKRTGPDYRHKRDRRKPKPVEETYFDMSDPKSWGFDLNAPLDLLWPKP